MSHIKVASISQEERLLAAKEVLRKLSESNGTVSSVPFPKGVACTVDIPDILCEAMGELGWAAVVGNVDVGWAYCADKGVDLSRVVFIPYPQEKSSACIDILLGAMAVVVADSNLLIPRARQRLVAKARARGTRLVWCTFWLDAIWRARHASVAVGAERRAS